MTVLIRTRGSRQSLPRRLPGECMLSDVEGQWVLVEIVFGLLAAAGRAGQGGVVGLLG
jgi:hypothetical protein